MRFSLFFLSFLILFHLPYANSQKENLYFFNYYEDTKEPYKAGSEDYQSPYVDYHEDFFPILNYSEAKKQVSKLRVKTVMEYHKLHREEDWFREMFPRSPKKYYEEFVSWEDFLGVEDAMPKRKPISNITNILDSDTTNRLDDLGQKTERVKTSKRKKQTEIRKQVKRKKPAVKRKPIERKKPVERKKADTNFVDYETAKKRAQEAGIKSAGHYSDWQKQHSDIPYNPDRTYKEFWEGWIIFLGKTPPSREDYEKLKKEVQEAGIKTSTQYGEWQKQYTDKPANPNRTYRKFWEGWKIFLGTNRFRAIDFVDYETAKKRAQEAGIQNAIEYNEWQKQQSDMPSHPHKIYKDKGWKGWGDFLGTDRFRGIEFVDYETAKKRAQEAGIKTSTQYKEWQKQHLDIPSNPNRTYKEFWKGWESFLGTNFVDYETAKQRAQEAGIKTSTQYNEWQKQHSDIPSNPNIFYKEFWKSWPSFLGKKTKNKSGKCSRGFVFKN